MGSPSIRKVETPVIEAIREASGIADDSSLRSEMLQRSQLANIFSEVTRIVDRDTGKERAMTVEEALPMVYGAQRRRNLKFLAPLVSKIMDSHINDNSQSWRRVKKVVDHLQKGKDPRLLRSPLDTFFADESLASLEDPNDFVLAAIMQDEDAGRELMDAVDNTVEQKSQKLLEEIDKLAKEGKRKRFDLGIIGGGPNTSTALTAVGPLLETVVICKQSQLAQDWRYNPIFINSSSNVKTAGSTPLPLLAGITTGITPRRLLGGIIRAADLIGKAAMTIRFKTKILDPDTGQIVRKSKTKKFLSGSILGRGSGINIAANSDCFLMNQEVIPQKTKILSDNVNLITMRDERDGTIREIELVAPLFNTGTGKEKLAINNPETQEFYQASEIQVEELIKSVELQVQSGERPTFTIPRLLTLSSIRKLVRMWEKTLQRNPDLYPFTPIFKSGVEVGEVGGGDTTRTMTEFFGGNGPRESYPEDFNFDEIPNQTLHNVEQKSRQEYVRQNRSRYATVYTEFVSSKPGKVRLIKPSIVNKDKVFVLSERREASYYDYVIVSTGFERDPIEKSFQEAGIEIEEYKDLEGETVGLGNSRSNILINGPATGFTRNDFPKDIQRVIEALGIKENTVALWVYQILISRMMWSHVARNGVNKEKVTELLQSAHSDAPESLFADTEASIM